MERIPVRWRNKCGKMYTKKQKVQRCKKVCLLADKEEQTRLCHKTTHHIWNIIGWMDDYDYVSTWI